MNKKLDALLGRSNKTSKYESLANLAISRIAILKQQCRIRYSQAWSDVSQLLSQNHQRSALLRVEHVIKEQNMLIAFVIIENYFHLLIDKVEVIESSRKCPDELKEAISSLIFAASRCAKFPELQHVRELLTSRFGYEFATHAIELRSNSGVNPELIQQLSAQQASLESRLKVLILVASESGITLDVKDNVIVNTKGNTCQKQQQHEPLETDLYEVSTEDAEVETQ